MNPFTASSGEFSTIEAVNNRFKNNASKLPVFVEILVKFL